MQLLRKVSPVYFPQPEKSTVLHLGLKKLEPGEWLIVDEDFGQFHANKLHVRNIHGDKVYAALPGSEPAQQELQQLVLGHLTNEHSNTYEISGSNIKHKARALNWSLGDESLWQTSLWVQEDICLMELRDGEYCLTAASVCAPSNWPLEQKIGRSLDDIHGPVPGYGQQLSRRVNRLFANLRPDRPLFRFNWSVQQYPELFWRKDLDKQPAQLDLNKGWEKGFGQGANALFWRVERQTLRRLPQSGAIVFTIRIFIHSFAALELTSGFTTNLGQLIGALPIAEKKYKGLLDLENLAVKNE